MSERKLHFETLQIHGGYHVDESQARGIAIHPTAAYHFPTCDYAANLFTLSEPGYIYTRLHNPTTAAYEERIAALYGGVGALATASGMSAILLTVTALAKKGENIVASPYLYGGTHNQFVISLRNLGVECRLAASDAAEDMAKLVDENTRALFVESMGNPPAVWPISRPLPRWRIATVYRSSWITPSVLVVTSATHLSGVPISSPTRLQSG